MRWLLFTLLCTELTASYCCTRMELGGEVIYWKAWGRPFEKVKPDYDWSFRVNGSMTSMDGLSYTSIGYLQFFSRDFVRPFQLKWGYRTGEVQVGHDFLRGCAHNLTLFAGGRYALVRRREIRPLQEDQSRFEGGGPEIGLNGAYLVGGGWSVVGQMSMASIIGVRLVKRVEPNITREVQAQTTCLPGFRFRLGASYTATGCYGVDLLGEIGFECDYYLQVVETFSGNRQNAGFGGPYFAVWVRF